MNNVFEIQRVLESIKYFREIRDIKEYAKKLARLYSKTDIVKQLYKMELWLDVNPKRLKKNYAKFIYNWLNRCELTEAPVTYERYGKNKPNRTYEDYKRKQRENPAIIDNIKEENITDEQMREQIREFKNKVKFLSGCKDMNKTQNGGDKK